MIMQDKLFLSQVIKFHSFKESGEYKIIVFSNSFSVCNWSNSHHWRKSLKFQNEIVGRLFFSI